MELKSFYLVTGKFKTGVQRNGLIIKIAGEWMLVSRTSRYKDKPFVSLYPPFDNGTWRRISEKELIGGIEKVDKTTYFRSNNINYNIINSSNTVVFDKLIHIPSSKTSRVNVCCDDLEHYLQADFNSIPNGTRVFKQNINVGVKRYPIGKDTLELTVKRTDLDYDVSFEVFTSDKPNTTFKESLKRYLDKKENNKELNIESYIKSKHPFMLKLNGPVSHVFSSDGDLTRVYNGCMDCTKRNDTKDTNLVFSSDLIEHYGYNKEFVERYIAELNKLGFGITIKTDTIENLLKASGTGLTAYNQQSYPYLHNMADGYCFSYKGFDSWQRYLILILIRYLWQPEMICLPAKIMNYVDNGDSIWPAICKANNELSFGSNWNIKGSGNPGKINTNMKFEDYFEALQTERNKQSFDTIIFNF